MSSKLKQPTTYDEQLEILISRQCIIDDEEFCLQKLKEVNYYRITAYFLPFKEKSGNYKQNTSFKNIIRIYDFDKSLRHILFTCIEEIEVFLKSNFAYYHVHKYGTLGYLKKDNFSEHHKHEKFTTLINKEIENNRKVLFVKHHIEHYDGNFPLWVIMELFTFGMLSHFYADLKTSDKKHLSRDLYDNIPPYIESYLRCCTDLRNICAHYGRLYYRIFPAIPRGVTDEKTKRRLWGTMQAVKNLFPNNEKWNNEVLSMLNDLFNEYKNDINLLHIGFPSNWCELLKK